MVTVTASKEAALKHLLLGAPVSLLQVNTLPSDLGCRQRFHVAASTAFVSKILGCLQLSLETRQILNKYSYLPSEFSP